MTRLTVIAVFAAACSSPSTTQPKMPSSAALGSPLSRFCASDNPCPGITKEKLEVCGECDPSTRYFRRSICSLDNKVRKAVDSCVEAGGGAHISGKAIFGSSVKACVRQRLSNEPTVLKNFIAIARGHEAKAGEQKQWRNNCEVRWSTYRGTKGESKQPEVEVGVGTLFIKTKPAYVEVWIDGKRQPRLTPSQGFLKLADMANGERQVELRYNDTHRLKTKVVVVASQEKKYTLRLESVPRCDSNSDCVGSEAGPICDTRKRRCSCEAASQCTSAPHTFCKQWWHNMSYNTCQGGLAGHYCMDNDQCKSGQCDYNNARNYGRCAK